MKTHYLRLDALGVTYYIAPPYCASSDRAFTDSIEVALTNPVGRGAIYYTLDGSDPSPGSTRYIGPFQLTNTTTVKARAFLTAERASGIVEYRFRKQEAKD